MLNKNIIVDLHIHSDLSFYKDGKIVENSSIDNVNILLEKLDSHQVSMFSITDHNSFNIKLYESIIKKICHESNQYKHLKKLLPGIEFDVKFKEDAEVAHIIVIFNDKDSGALLKINSVMEKKQKTNKNDYYGQKDFEDLLKEIGLDTIIIAHQKSAINLNKAGYKSISESFNDKVELYQILKIGYIDAFEYSTSRQEGIVLNSLKEVKIDVPLITGSDCHDWSVYPAHSKEQPYLPSLLKLKSLPTFKGLHISLTSIETRRERLLKNNNFIEKILYKDPMNQDVSIELSKGLNAIIGDNGSGKSYLFSKLINKENSKYNTFKKLNPIEIKYKDIIPGEDILFIEQNELVEAVKDGKLFENKGYYNDISHKEFEANINSWKEELNIYFLNKINFYKHKKDVLNSIYHIQNENIEKFRLTITVDLLDEVTNVHTARLDKLKEIRNNIELEINNQKKYYQEYDLLNKFTKVKNEIEEIINQVDKLHKKVIKEAKINGIVKKECNEYNKKVKTSLSTEDKLKKEIDESNTKVINDIVKYFILKSKLTTIPQMPKISKEAGITEKIHSNFKFVRRAKYNQVDLEETIINYFFKRGTNYDNLKKITTLEELFDICLRIPRDKFEIDIFTEWFNDRTVKFLDDLKEEETYINDITSGHSAGVTAGEMSLIYYNFQLNGTDKKVIIIDQPEDDINPLKINEELKNYLNSVRDDKQVIFITHNPALVVNLDVDNVISLKSINNKMKMVYGCLEYEDEDVSILKEIEKNLDGGYEAIEKRLKLYEKDIR